MYIWSERCKMYSYQPLTIHMLNTWKTLSRFKRKIFIVRRKILLNTVKLPRQSLLCATIEELFHHLTIPTCRTQCHWFKVYNLYVKTQLYNSNELDIESLIWITLCLHVKIWTMEIAGTVSSPNSSYSYEIMNNLNFLAFTIVCNFHHKL